MLMNYFEFIRFLKKIRLVISQKGLSGLLIKCISKIGVKFSYTNLIEKRKILIGKKIYQMSNGKIVSGYYKDTKIIPKSSWTMLDFPSKILGTYELKIQEKIFNLSTKFKLDNIFSIGSADGYHLIGPLKNNFFKSGFAYDKNNLSYKILNNNAKINGVKNKIKILNNFSEEFLKKNFKPKELNKSLFVIDIEGSEFKLLSYSFLNFLKKSFFIIELHDEEIDKLNDNMIKSFYLNINKFFKCEYINNVNINFDNLEILNNFDEDSKMLSLSESRPGKMNWLILRPK